MNELIRVNYTNDRPTVLSRDLHAMLEVETPYHKWFPRMCEYGFFVGVDYMEVKDNFVHNPLGGRPATDHQLAISMAKELCMLQRTEKGKQCRQYFISIEEAWNKPEAIMARALQMAQKTVSGLKQANSELAVQNAIMSPKAEYFDELVDRNLLTGFRETAKQLGVGPKAFVKFLLNHKYVYRDQKGKLMPYAQYTQNGLFELKEKFNEKTEWAGTQTLITPKGREVFRLLMAV